MRAVYRDPNIYIHVQLTEFPSVAMEGLRAFRHIYFRATMFKESLTRCRDVQLLCSRIGYNKRSVNSEVLKNTATELHESIERARVKDAKTKFVHTANFSKYVLTIRSGGAERKPISLGLESPTWVIIAQEHALAHILQPIVPLPSIPTRVFTLESKPQGAYYDDIANEITHSLRIVFSVPSESTNVKSHTTQLAT
jgi:hypothetical protein